MKNFKKRVGDWLRSKPQLTVRCGNSYYRLTRLKLTSLEDRITPALPDLVGFDFRPSGFPTAYMHVEEASPSWGDQIHIDYAYLNQGAGSTASSQTFSISLYLTTNSTINPATDFRLAHLVNSGFTVPAFNSGSFWIFTLTLPASNPLSPLTSGPFTLGAFIDADNTVAETNDSNNINQGTAKDLTTVNILSPAAVVTDSQGSSSDHAINFGSVVTDGVGNALTTQTVTLTDSAARSLLKVLQNGISLTAGTNFHIVNILSNKLSQTVNVAGGNSLLAANSSEAWTIQLSFDPLATGSLTDTLKIQTDDPANPIINVALSGTGTPQSNLVVTNPSSQTLNFGNVAVDGAGGAKGTATVTLANNGSGPLNVSQNGITVAAGPFAVTGIVSSTQGTINLATGPKTMAAGGAETWTVSLTFDPTATGLFQVPLTITTDAPLTPTVVVSLLGTGQTPQHLVVVPTSVAFGSVPADGPGLQLATQTVTLTNTGQLPLQVNQNGMTLVTGTHFKIASVASSTQGVINLGSGPATLAGSSAETWTATLQFDPSAAGSLSDTFRIVSNDPATPTLNVSLTGTGLDQPILVVTDSDTPNNDLIQGFPATLNDGTGGKSSLQTLTLTNIGTQPLVVSQNGITFTTGTNYQIVSVVSSTNGSINLAAGSGTIAIKSAETWTVTVRFDPLSNGTISDTLHIASNDPVHPTTNVALNGQGVVPTVAAIYPMQAVHVSASRAYRLTWNGVYVPGTGTVSLYYDTDRNSASGLVAIVSSLPQKQSTYDWQVPAGLVGGTYTIYVKLQDGAVAAANYAAGSLTVDAANSDRLLSAPVTDTAAYSLSYAYNGTTYVAPYALSLGDNTLYPTGGGVTHEYHIFRAATLVDADSTAYDSLSKVTSTTDSNSQTITYTRDLLSRVTHVAYLDGTGVDYTYDASSNLLTMHDATGWQIYGYDVLNRLTSVTYSPTNNINDPAALTIGYQYDLANRLVELDYPSGKRVLYGYDNAGKLTSVTEKNSGQSDLVTNYTYSATTGLLTTETRPNDTQTIYSYDSNGQLIDILHRRTSTQALVLQYHYTLDAANRRTLVVITTPSGTTAQAYAYDDLERLVQVTYSDNNGTIESTDRVVKYTYDLNGNRLTQTTYASGVANGATETLTYAYGFEDRLQTVTDQGGVVRGRYAYDWRGNTVELVTPTATTLFKYDGRSLLVSADDGTNHVEYQYDGAGRRVAQTVNGLATQFVVDPSSAVYQTLEERASGGSLNAGYVYGLDRIGGVLPGSSSPVYYLKDGLGSVGSLTSSNGSLVGNYS
ncbi:MAG TPA: choice-of-anchor D domain-containing protein, partial [Gemmataceae bacterium]|nr:choice-of-anchor D domain-containing protein [Gemmataceae bacterium]